MATEDTDHLLTVTFHADAVKNDAKTAAAGRPIFDDVELCHIRTSGDRDSLKVFPAHSFHRWITGDDGGQEIQTYAQRWNAQYRRFKEKRQQVQEGTPLAELPFLTEAKRSELKALSIYTAEQLSSLDGRNLKSLGMGGRELKDQAAAYIKAATGSASVTRMAAQMAEMQAEIDALRAGREIGIAASDDGEDDAEPEQEPDDGADDADFAQWSDDDLKGWIAQHAGARPKGNPNHETLVRMAREVTPKAA